MSFQPNQTHLNLMLAFAGESQARNRYTMAAEQAGEKGFPILQQIFQYTADQERAHAKVFYDFLSDAAGENIAITVTFPIDPSPTITALLHAAHHNETEEAQRIYPVFADQAEKDNMPAVAHAFRQIAAVEALHAARFHLFGQRLETETLYMDNQGNGIWMCQNCGHIHVGKKAPGICPVCSHNQGYFCRAEEAPFTDITLLESENSARLAAL